MKNFIFKSETDFHKIVFNKLDMILAELRHQRLDMTNLLRLTNLILNDRNLQRQVDKYYDLEDDPKNIPEEKQE